MSAPKMIQYVSSKEYLFGDLSRPCAGNTGAVFYYNFLKLLRGPLNRHTMYGSGIS